MCSSFGYGCGVVFKVKPEREWNDGEEKNEKLTSHSD
jgi:hypothetical protein